MLFRPATTQFERRKHTVDYVTIAVNMRMDSDIDRMEVELPECIDVKEHAL